MAYVADVLAFHLACIKTWVVRRVQQQQQQQQQQAGGDPLLVPSVRHFLDWRPCNVLLLLYACGHNLVSKRYPVWTRQGLLGSGCCGAVLICSSCCCCCCERVPSVDWPYVKYVIYQLAHAGQLSGIAHCTLRRPPPAQPPSVDISNLLETSSCWPSWTLDVLLPA
jgi:hypothetical protein